MGMGVRRMTTVIFYTMFFLVLAWFFREYRKDSKVERDHFWMGCAAFNKKHPHWVKDETPGALYPTCSICGSPAGNMWGYRHHAPDYAAQRVQGAGPDESAYGVLIWHTNRLKNGKQKLGRRSRVRLVALMVSAICRRMRSQRCTKATTLKTCLPRWSAIWKKLAIGRRIVKPYNGKLTCAEQ